METAVILGEGIEFINATVAEIDVESRSVRFDDQQLQADVLIIALGASTDSGTIPGLRESGINIYSPEGMARIHETGRPRPVVAPEAGVARKALVALLGWGSGT